MKRVIYIEPSIDNSDILDIFNKYNPDSSFVNPHICIVFPFESNLSTYELENVINNIFSKYNSFNIILKGLSISYEEKNNFLFLNVIDINNILNQMSDELYKCIDSAERKGEYIPHITIGKNKDIDEINKIYSYSKNILNGEYNALISSIYCKKFNKDINGNIYLEDEIEYKLPQVSIEKKI